jgi:hypothetical protein
MLPTTYVVFEIARATLGPTRKAHPAAWLRALLFQYPSIDSRGRLLVRIGKVTVVKRPLQPMVSAAGV